MPDIIKPNQGIVFMKVGVHAQETLEDIIQRKTKEIEDAGYALWGYGGGTCHPRTMIQPFANLHVERGEKIYLCMQKMESKHYAEPVRATHFSLNGADNWEEIHPAINVKGSRYALAIKSLREENFALPLSHTRVALGNTKGREGNRYIIGRVDKACLEFTDDVLSPDGSAAEPLIQIGLVAELCEPYAVFLKN